MSKIVNMPKGVRDWYGKEAITRNKIKDSLRKVFESYGFSPLETPIIELQDVISIKGGEEISKETFTLSDQGNRKLALRFDHTVPLARFFSYNSKLNLPFKRYAIGEVFRDGPTQPEQGRYRSFTQCDIDILGVEYMSAEVELLGIVKKVFKNLGLSEVEVRLNNRKILEDILGYVGIREKDNLKVMSSLDKLDKLSEIEVAKEILDKVSTYVCSDTIKHLFEVIKKEDTNLLTYEKLMRFIPKSEGLKEVKEILTFSQQLDYSFVKLDPSLARGLDYYTGTTMEAYLEDKQRFKSAIAAGGRFDDMVGEFYGVGKKIPAVGISFGLERLVQVLDEHNLNTRKSITDIFIIPVGGISDYALKVAENFRDHNLNVDINYINNTKIGKLIKNAYNNGIKFVGIIGDQEEKTKTITLKNLETGEQSKMSFQLAYTELARDRVIN